MHRDISFTESAVADCSLHGQAQPQAALPALHSLHRVNAPPGILLGRRTMT